MCHSQLCLGDGRLVFEEGAVKVVINVQDDSFVGSEFVVTCGWCFGVVGGISCFVSNRRVGWLGYRRNIPN